MPGGFSVLGRTNAFKRDFKALDTNLQSEVLAAIKDLALPNISASRRFHNVDKGRPKVYTVDITSNKSHKMSFEIEGTAVTLRRVGTHREIDRNY